MKNLRLYRSSLSGGYIDSETMFLFMQEDIENVSFVGFVDAEMQVFRTALEETDENDAEKESDS